jgi:N-acetylmuramoyl-L-alanine amidase-like protein
MGPRGRVEPEETRFLLVHHTASANQYVQDDVAEFIRGVYRQHTATGWVDVAYNFFVDRYGGCWEGRDGSLARPVVCDASGGNQGYAQLVCLIGNFQEVSPTAASVEALVDVLAWLADRDGVDPSPGATVEFVSRGSNRWPAGETVCARTIAGHREMSRTLCPGDHLFALLEHDVPMLVANERASR